MGSSKNVVRQDLGLRSSASVELGEYKCIHQLSSDRTVQFHLTPRVPVLVYPGPAFLTL